MVRHSVTRGWTLAFCLAASATMLAQSASFTYDPSEEVTVSGTIVHVVTFIAPDDTVGVHFDFQTSSGMLNVHVAPAMFLGMQNVSYFGDDRVEIVGLKTFVDGNKAFVARRVTKEGKTLSLRGADGKPAWTPVIEGTDGCGVEHPALPRGTER